MEKSPANAARYDDPHGAPTSQTKSVDLPGLREALTVGIQRPPLGPVENGACPEGARRETPSATQTGTKGSDPVPMEGEI